MKVGTAWRKHSFHIGISQGSLQQGRTYVFLFLFISTKGFHLLFFKETNRQKVQLESENRALRDKVCICHLTHLFQVHFQLKHLNFVSLFPQLQDTQNRLSSLESELIKLKPLLLMQPYSVAHLRQNFTFPQTPDGVLTTSQVPHRFPDVRPNKPTSDIKGKQREADSSSSRTQLEAISEDLGANEERGSGSTSLARSLNSASSTPSANLFSGPTTSTADIYRRTEPLPQYSYPYNYNYATPSASPSKSTQIPPKITLDSPSSNSTVHGQHHTTAAGSTSKSLGSTFPTYPSQSHPLPQASPTPSPQRRSRDLVNNTQNAPIRRRKQGVTPLTSDARIEHVLLAARRIGRERAGLVAGIKQHAEHEKEMYARESELIKARQDLEKSEKDRLERLANGTSGLAYYRSADILTSPQQRNSGRVSATAGVPRTPKRGGARVTHYPPLSGAFNNSPISSPTRVPASGPSTFVFVNTSTVAGTPGYSGGGDLSTPDRPGSAHKRGGTARGSRNLPNNPPTPLDSLLNAARSMIDDGAGAGEKAGGKMNGTRKAVEHPESPVPKRRRVSSSGSKVVGRGGDLAGTGKATRIKSALDVLADQAAAAFDDEPGQIRRGSNTKGKGKEKFDEGLSGGGDDNAQRDLDDFWPRPRVSTSTSASIGPSQGRSRAKTASINTRSTVEPTSISLMSLRPGRQASQKHLASREVQPSPSISTTTARGKGKSRGRPKGNKSLSQLATSVKSSPTSKMNSPLGPRVITTYSLMNDAIALLPQKDRRRERSEEHPRQFTTVDLDRSPSMGSLRLGLTPAEELRNRSAGDEDVEGELGLDQQNGYVEGNLDTAAGNVTTSGAETVIQTAAPIDTSSNDVSVDVDLMTIPPVDNVNSEANAEADLDDEDAEGEQEEAEDDDAEAGQDRSSRSRTPPPPDPTHPGASSDSNNDDPDADADAEGEMDFEEDEELPPTSTSSAVYQTALSGPIGQVPQGNFDGSFFDDDGWLIVLWIQPDKSFGYNTTSTRVLISAMVPGSLPSSPLILSDLPEKMTLRWLKEKSGQLVRDLDKY